MSSAIDPSVYRTVLGQYPTGVVVVTAVGHDGEALGMTVGSFTSVSLDPPLIAFLPSKTSSSWAALQSADKFCINILTSDQEDVGRAVATRKRDKFHGLEWRPSNLGNPILDGVVAWIDCTMENRIDAGDHEIVLGRVYDLEVRHNRYPLLFFRGGYGSFVPRSMATRDADLQQALPLVDCGRKQMERLAARFNTEVTAVTVVGNELVIVASAGHTLLTRRPTRVGARSRFMAPFGSAFAAFCTEDVQRRWLENAGDISEDDVAAHRSRLASVRERGYAITLHDPMLSPRMESAFVRYAAGGLDGAQTDPRFLREIMPLYNPIAFDVGVHIPNIRSLAAPAFAKDGPVAYVLTCWLSEEHRTADGFDSCVTALQEAACSATEAIRGL